MSLSQLERKLIAAARAHPPSDRVPYAFEKRIVARLAGRAISVGSELWARAWWRAAAACAAVMLVLGAWSFFAHRDRTPVNDLSLDLEQTLLAAVDQEQAADSTW